MAKKEIARYFTHDTGARNSEKLLRLRMRHRSAGYGIYFMILERLRDEPDYTSAKDYNMIAFDLREDAALIKSVVEDFGLFSFTDDGKRFYSESFLRRMQSKDLQRERNTSRAAIAAAARWNKTDITPPLPQLQQGPRSGAAFNDECYRRFFADCNKANIETLAMQLGLSPDSISTLHSLADEIVLEWNQGEVTHNDYSDWATHLMRTIRIKHSSKRQSSSSRRHTAKQPQQPQSPAPQSGDYDYNGGFGGTDV